MTSVLANQPAAASVAQPSVRVSRRGSAQPALPPIALQREGLSVGSLGDNHLVLAGQGIARRHLIIEWNGQLVSVTDLGGSAGTRLDSQLLAPYEPAAWLPGSALQVGDYILELQPGASASGPLALSVAPDLLALRLDAPVTLQVAVQNNDSVAHSVTVQLEGDLAPLATPSVAQLYLDPGEQEALSITVRAPSGGDKPGEHTMTIRAEPATSGLAGTATPSRWVVPAFSALALSLAPEQARAAAQTTYSLQVRNGGNVPAAYALSLAQQPELTCALGQTTVQLQPGEAADIPLTARTPQRLFAPPQSYSFTVQADGGVSDRPAIASGTFTRVNLLPRWLPLLPLLLLLILLLPLFRYLSTANANPNNPGNGAAPGANQGAAGQSAIAAASTPGATTPTNTPQTPRDERPTPNATIVDLNAQVSAKQTEIAFVTQTGIAQAAIFAQQTATAAASQTALAIANAQATASARGTQGSAGANSQTPQTAGTQTQATANAAPTVGPTITIIELNKTAIPENNAANSVVGTLSAKGTNLGTVQFSFASGGEDNSDFTILGSQLQAAKTFNYEDKNSYSIRIRASASGAESKEQSFTIVIEDENEPATDIKLSPNIVEENLPDNTQIGQLSDDDPDTNSGAIFELVDKDLPFILQGDELFTTRPLNFEDKEDTNYNRQTHSYAVKVRVRDSASSSNTFEDTVTVEVKDVNDKPSDIILTPNFISEGIDTEQPVATLDVIDDDAGQDHTFTLDPSSGDYSKFNIPIGTKNLYIREKPDFDAGSKSYTIRISVEDKGEPPQSFEKTFTIPVTGVNEKPSKIDLSNDTVEESINDQDIGKYVGTLSAKDPEGDSLTFTVIEGAQFTVASGNRLITKAPIDYETNKNVDVVIQVDDGKEGQPYKQQFSIEVKNINEPPTSISLTPHEVYENQDNVLVGSLAAEDPEKSTDLKFSLVSGDDDFFKIVDNNKIYTKSSLNYEKLECSKKDTHQCVVAVKVTDNGTPPQSYQQDVTINIKGANDPPKFKDHDAVAYISQDSRDNVIVIQLEIEDEDATGKYKYDYSISNPKFTNCFKINPSSNPIAGDRIVKIETQNSGIPDCTDLRSGNNTGIEITVTVHEVDENNNSIASDTTHVKIAILDVNHPPEFKENGYTKSISGIRDDGEFTTIKANDKDKDSLVFSFVVLESEYSACFEKIGGGKPDEITLGSKFKTCGLPINNNAVFHIRLEVTDNRGGKDEAELVVTINN